MKRLFLAFRVIAPWPEAYPPGRLIRESDRHMTLAFLGQVDLNALVETLFRFPAPPFYLGFTGYFDKVLFLPPKHQRVVAWNALLETGNEEVVVWQKKLTSWLKEEGFPPSGGSNEWLSHTSLCRSPFNPVEWKDAFYPIPFAFHEIILYESVGSLVYQPRWVYRLKPPFEEISHTADLAFRIRGRNMKEISKHAKTALAFRSPELLRYEQHQDDIELYDLIKHLNDSISACDSDIGCPIKSVSYHGELQSTSDGLIEWEMIADV